MRNGHFVPYVIKNGEEKLFEIPVTVTRVMGRPMCFFGGGYLRLFPLALIRKMTAHVLKEGRPVVFYVHPREIDPEQPRLRMGLGRRFKSYVNLDTTAQKLRELTAEFEHTTFQQFIQDYQHTFRND